LRGFKLNIVFWSFYISVHLRVPMFPSLLIFDVLQLCTVFYYIGIHSKKQKKLSFVWVGSLISCLQDGLCILFQSVLFQWFVFIQEWQALHGIYLELICIGRYPRSGHH
jgi:hypothetical protein